MLHRPCLALSLALAPAAAGAHPHVFVDSELTIVIDDAGRITGTEMIWSYDEFFSLLILEDMGLDADTDGVLSASDREALMGFDFVTWPEGFEGDLYLEAAGAPVPLGHPVSTSIDLVEGRIVSSHTRTVPDVPAEGAVFRHYDPTYYVSYMLGAVEVTGGCRADVVPPDPDAGERALAEALESFTEDQFEVLRIGIHHADTVMLSCASSS